LVLGRYTVAANWTLAILLTGESEDLGAKGFSHWRAYRSLFLTIAAAGRAMEGRDNLELELIDHIALKVDSTDTGSQGSTDETRRLHVLTLPTGFGQCQISARVRGACAGARRMCFASGVGQRPRLRASPGIRSRPRSRSHHGSSFLLLRCAMRLRIRGGDASSLEGSVVLHVGEVAIPFELGDARDPTLAKG